MPRQADQYLLPEAYIKINWKHWGLMVGRERRIIGIVDTTLTSGSYSWSGNSLPVPMVRLSVEDYIPLGILKNIISFKGSYVHGWFNVPYIQGAYLHQKTFYGRLGKPEGRFHFQFGLAHSVTWGGSADYLRDSPVAVNGKLTTNFGDYVWGVVLGKIPRDKMNSRFTMFDGTNRVGNHVGHYDMALDWKIKKTSFLFYRQHPFEDASGLQFQNLPDGLYGLSIRRGDEPPSFVSVKKFVAEFLYTRNQSGPVFDPAARYQGRDDYFNHAQYRQGWSYLNHGMGTPFIPLGEGTRQEVYADREFFPTNQTKLIHLGVELLLAKKIRLLAKYSSGMNFGTFNVPFLTPVRQQSSLLSLDAPLFSGGNTRIKAQLAYDKGGLYPESLGGYLGFRSSFSKRKDR
ncbi:capsule assembly Wzi family protein [Persicitalea sp.]|uniref:capsule assembly Wzi family protein n=1 Tax=Persicitalea sp. TaxID=3100273 RepID=UPI0035931F5F